MTLTKISIFGQRRMVISTKKNQQHGDVYQQNSEFLNSNNRDCEQQLPTAVEIDWPQYFSSYVLDRNVDQHSCENANFLPTSLHFILACNQIHHE